MDASELESRPKKEIIHVRILQGPDWRYETQLPDWARDDYVYSVQPEKRD